MNRQLTALFAAFEAILVVAIGVAIPLVPLTLLWGIQFGLAIDWAVFWRVSVDTWLLGHGVDIAMTLDPVTAAQLGLPAAGEPFTLTIALLGFALLTVLLGIRAGRRVAETRHRILGELVSLATFALASFAVTFTALHPDATPSLVQGTLLPTLVFAVGMAIGVRRTRNLQDDRGSSIRDWINDWPASVRAIVVTALRGGAAAAASVVTLAAVLTAAAILLSYARIITLYEGLHTEVLGGVTITLAQLALLPNLVIYTASWLVGPGFALGTGSAVSPLATQLGPVPAIPVLGALPPEALAFGFVGLLVPVVAGFLVGAILGPGARKKLGRGQLALVAVGIGLVGGVVLGLLAWASTGAAGPGRLQDVGPDPLAVGGWAALELGLAAMAGLFASLKRSAVKVGEAER
ncbi:hypothetical protein IWX81_001975 [Salinibacterium sp. CAN_S4]|uniref:cell division protein PerM n=1 Tax=Salinibacterium sp. CAN_S4 TaxID=2787727 RepID=UPI0018F00A1B